MIVNRRLRTLQRAMVGAAAVIAAGLCVAPPARAQVTSTAPTPIARSRVPTGRLTGEVTDMRGTPLAGTSVAVTDMGGKSLATATTDAKGIFTVDELPEGEYILNFDAKGFYKKTQKAHVKVGKTDKVHTKLKFIPIY